MNVVQIITSAEWGGAQRHVYDLSRGLGQLGHQLTVLYGIEGKLHTRLASAGIKTGQIAQLTRTIQPWKDLTALSEIRRQIMRHHPDIVHVHSSKAGTLVRLAMRSSGIPVVYTIHGLVYVNSRMPTWKQAIYRTIELGLLPMANVTIAVSLGDLEVLRRDGGDRKTRLIHIPNGIDPFPQAIPLPDQPVVGTVARFTPEKALDVLLRAVAKIRQRIPGLKLILVGDGPLRQELEHLAGNLSIDDITTFAGFQEDILPWLTKMRVFALTSVKEGMPYSVLEAAEAGRIVVANDVGAMRELSARVPMSIVRGTDVDAWAKAIEGALTKPSSLKGHTPTASAMVHQVDQAYHMVVDW
jgi:glycosyltransferase involved in cell wall biosynthesis